MCECGLFSINSANELLTVRIKDNKFQWLIADKIWDNIKFCYFCGTLANIDNDIEEQFPEFEKLKNLAQGKVMICICDYLPNLAKKDSNYLEFDEESKNYFLIFENAKSNINFCIDCGGGLFSCDDDNLFIPSTIQVAEISKKIERAKSIADIINILGTPNKKYTFSLSPRIKSRIEYHNILHSINLLVFEKISGKIDFEFIGRTI